MKCELVTRKSSSSSQKMKTVLIVDDSDDIKKSFSYIVKSLGFEIFLANNGREAFDRYKEKMPDVVFMDVRMPIMNGCDAFKKIKEFDRNAVIFFITAFSGDQCVVCLEKTQNISIIEKPFQISKIVEILKPYR